MKAGMNSALQRPPCDRRPSSSTALAVKDGSRGLQSTVPIETGTVSRRDTGTRLTWRVELGLSVLNAE